LSDPLFEFSTQDRIQKMIGEPVFGLWEKFGQVGDFRSAETTDARGDCRI